MLDETDFILFGAKRCGGCGRTWPASADYFNRDRHRRDGLTTLCRECRRARSRRRYQDDPSIRERQTAWARAKRREVSR